MGRYPLTGDDGEELFVADGAAGVVSLRIPPAEPVAVTVEQAEHVRQLLGAAIADAQAGDSRPAHDEGLRGSQRGEDDA